MARGAPPPRRPGRGMRFWMYVLLIGVTLIAVAFPTIIVFGVGMLPAMAALITDRTDQKYGFFCIGSLNFTGVFPYLMDLWSGNHNITGAINIITDVFGLSVMYGSAMAGWIVYTVIPPVITSFMTVLTERRLSALRANQRRIIDEWGDEVTMGIRAPNGAGRPSGPPGAAFQQQQVSGPGGGVLAAQQAMAAIEAKDDDADEEAGAATPG